MSFFAEDKGGQKNQAPHQEHDAGNRPPSIAGYAAAGDEQSTSTEEKEPS